MPKIGILTYHYCFNYGSFLQVYSLQNFLNDCGFKNFVIDYRNPQAVSEEYRALLFKFNPHSIYLNFNKIRKFKSNQSRLITTKPVHNSKAINSENFDIVLFGGDEIWNYNHPLFDYEPLFFGKNLTVKKSISYAASFGSADPNQVCKHALNLRSFDAVSVREKNSYDMAASVYHSHIPIVLDPVFLYDMASIESEISCKNYILIYGVISNDSLVTEILNFAKNNRKICISVGYKNRWCDKNFIDIDAFEILGFYRKADFVVTSMFHGTMFAIIYNKIFAAIVTPYKINKLSLLKSLELGSNLVNDHVELGRALGSRIDYDRVNAIIAERKKISTDFLLRNLQ